jgi:hypothetical protein
VNHSNAETWSRVAETAILSLVFLSPLAVHGSTWDPAALRTALVQAAALTLAAVWILKGLTRGRWEAASGSWTTLLPALALAAWSLTRFAVAPFKAAALPGLCSTLTALVLFAIAMLELGGARHAARLAFWTTAAAACAAGVGVLPRLGISGVPVLSPDQLAAFAAAALPVTLALRLDPEATPARRLFSAATAAALATTAAWSGSASGLAFFVLSAVIFAGAAITLLRGPEARRDAALALGCAALAVAAFAVKPGFSSLGPLVFDVGGLRAFAGSGRVAAVLVAWLIVAAAARGFGAAWDLRRRGALAEAGYAAGLFAAFAAWSMSAAAGLTPTSGPAAWLAWTAAGVAAGLSPLSRPHGIVRVMPLPFGEDVRRLMQGPVLMLFAALALGPGLWLVSDVNYNRAVAESRAGAQEPALADAGRVWPGAAVYPSALYLRGRVLMDQGKPAEALAAYARLDDVAPDLSRLHARKAEAYAALGDWSNSSLEHRRQDALTPLDVPNLTAWAEAARAAGDLTAARSAAARADELAPDDEAVKTQLAANALMERKLAAKDGALRRGGRKGLALKPKTR